MVELVLESHSFLLVRILLPQANIASCQILVLFEFPMPAFERILCRIAQLPNGRSSAFAEFFIELDGSNAI